MFESLKPIPADPILGVIAQFNSDPRDHKIDLGVGVYRDEHLQTPVLSSVKQAEEFLLASETSKAYIGPVGNSQFNALMIDLALGADHSAKSEMALVQTPGGCGALRVAAELIKRAYAGATIWVSDPTWGNHMPLLGDAGIQLKTYPYYDFETHQLRFDAMMAGLVEVKKGDLVLLHACCHNPSGADLTREQWHAISDLAQLKGFVPFVDMAYQGFGEDVASDAYGLRLLCEHLPEVLLAVSCSKNFGLYRERVGAVALKSAAPQIANSHFASIVRGIYSMPPAHGAAIVAHILANKVLFEQWLSELGCMRERILEMRTRLVDQLRSDGAGGRFDHIQHQRGMFSFLGLSASQVQDLAQNHAVYMVESSRINLAGLSEANIQPFCQALLSVM
ncbi:aspartate aminotransferase [Alteromonadaceae bacterium 2753L.S.0a.02]|nr:aspartate aminotransferase [Alteromonadaceae bacterium 2753L.S.0a.02]